MNVEPSFFFLQQKGLINNVGWFNGFDLLVRQRSCVSWN